jgi:hypothetical protein
MQQIRLAAEMTAKLVFLAGDRSQLIVAIFRGWIMGDGGQGLLAHSRTSLDNTAGTFLSACSPELAFSFSRRGYNGLSKFC